MAELKLEPIDGAPDRLSTTDAVAPPQHAASERRGDLSYRHGAHGSSDAASSGVARVGTTLSRAERSALARTIGAHRTAIIASWMRSQFDARLIERHGIAGVREAERASIELLFVAPLVELFIAFVRTGEARYRDVYLDERLRYAPFMASPADRAAFFGELLPEDERAVLSVHNWSDTEAGALLALMTDLHTPLRNPPTGSPVRVLAVGDCLLNELRVFLAGASARAGVTTDIRNLYFSAGANRALDAAEVLAFIEREGVDIVALSFLTYEGVPAYRALLHEGGRLSDAELDERVDAIIALMREFVSTLRDRTEAPFLVHGTSGLPLSRWRGRVPLISPLSASRRRTLRVLNRKIRELVDHTPNAIFIDEAAIAAGAGLRACEEPVIPRSVVRRAVFHTSRFGEVLSAAYAQIIAAYAQLHRTKVLLVDFDDTLWQGVMAEGSVVHARERQRLLLRLKDAGILLVAVSKNDPANIRWDEMLLKPADFALLKISWAPKAGAIRAAAEELDLGLDSMVFIDDNPLERALVSAQLPGVRTLDATEANTWDALSHMLCFPNTKETPEARSRTEKYQQQAARRASLSNSGDDPATMAALNLRATFGRAAKGHLARVAELVQRTNQFNTTTIRYTKQELTALMSDDTHRVYVCSLSDKFGDLGLVAVAIVERRNEEAVVVSFVMSCRAMGLQLERLMMRLVLDAERGAKQYVGRFVATDRNHPARSLFADNGFLEAGLGEWRLDASSALPAPPPWFQVSGRD